ncbi:hypothetical protein BK011_07850 [Tenericutes bacterium MZ-XQ]|nr:hypothetical protein BK011_07850 [Tenericutes bacterium MZ-XQ]
MNIYKVGQYIKSRRTELQLTQKQLADRLNISFQAVSKWETGSTLPDTSLLLKLSDVLEVTVDHILTPGGDILRTKEVINIANIYEAFRCIKKIGLALGQNNQIYKNMMNGLNKDGEINFLEALDNPEKMEVIVAKSCIQLMMDGQIIKEDEIDKHFKNEDIKKKLILYSKKYK